MARKGKILVVGGQPKNWRDLLQEPRMIFWSNDEADRKTSIPAGVVQVIASRFVSHTPWDKVKEIARKQGVCFSVQLMGPGEIKQLLQAFKTPKVVKPPRVATLPAELLRRMREEERVMPAVIKPSLPAEQPGAPKPQKGEVSKLIRAEANFDASSHVEEVKRLQALAQSRGLSSIGIENAYYRIRAEKYGRLKPQKEGARTEKVKIRAKKSSSAQYLREHAETLALHVLEVVTEVEKLSAGVAALRTRNRELETELKRLRGIERIIQAVEKSRK
ncbi:MAG: hypothetical protein AAB686_02930 [Patescibacteria group bacterium]